MLAQNSSITVSCGKILFNKKFSLDKTCLQQTAAILYQLINDQSIPILILEQMNRGITGIPILKLTLTYMKEVVQEQQGDKLIVEKLLGVLKLIIGYGGPKKEQCRQAIKGMIPECYQVCKEAAVLQSQFAEMAMHIVNEIEGM